MNTLTRPFTPNLSKTAQAIQPFHVMKILGEAKQLEEAGRDIIHLEIGEPDFPSLTCLAEAAHQAMQKGLTHYTPTMGLPQLREKLSAFYQHFYNAHVDANHIMLTPGSSSALQLVLTSLLNPNDKVMMADPSYPCNRQFVTLLQSELVLVPVTKTSNYQLNLELIKANWQDGIKVLMLASPSNPTGTVIEQDELLNIVHFVASRQGYVIMDEIYQGLVYNRPAESILANKHLPDNVIVINSFSKFFGMTGWRLGWAVAPDHLIPILNRLGQNLFLAAPTPAQYAALRVLESDALAELDKRRTVFETRRDALLTAMKAAGLKVSVRPQGAFYLYWDVSEYTQDSKHFCSALLRKTGVAITPGRDFGDYKASQYVRIAYTCDVQTLKTAVDRIRKFLFS